MILGLDISTSVVGITIFSDDYKFQEISYVFKKGTNLFVKLDEFIEVFKKYSAVRFSHIGIEEPLKAFKGKFSSADTIQKLTQMNALISGYLYRATGIEPTYFNVNAARKLVFPTLTIPQQHPNKKSLIWESVMKLEPTINWIYSQKTFKLKDENYDMADSYVIAMAMVLTVMKSSKKIKEVAQA
jgi:hypothetical protein